MFASRFVTTAVAVGFCVPASAQLGDLEEALRTTPITSEQIGDNLYVLFGVGGAMVVSIGDQGVLTVDDQFPEMAPKYEAKIRELGGGDIDFTINTHWHFDHADGNKALGPEGTWLVAHETSRDMMMRDNVINLVTSQRDQPAYPPAALPVITFTEGMMFHFNAEPIELLHFGPAHTAGDAAVIFRGHDAVHMGDVFNNAGYPFIDADNGGSLEGLVEFCRAVLERIGPDTTVVPGHGPIATYADLERYVEALSSIRERMSALVEEGATLEQVVAARPTAEWDEQMGDPSSFIDRAYASLTR